MKTSRVTCILPVKDMARARRFYEDRLQLEPTGQRPDGSFLYRCAGTHIALIPKPEGTKAEHTAASFEVTDIVAAIRELQSRGVTFADYDLPGLKTVNHICDLGAEKAAWFTDTEGNILCLHEEKA